jgi:hypothetical protein
MAGQEKDTLMDECAGALRRNTRRYAEIVGLSKVDEGADIRIEVQGVYDPLRIYAAGETLDDFGVVVLRAKFRGYGKQRADGQSGEQSVQAKDQRHTHGASLL